MRNIHNKVLVALQNDERARCDDTYLYYLICKQIIDSECMRESFEWVLINHNLIGLPSFESVRRARQKIQATYSELKDEFTAEKRGQKEQEYLAYARADI